jgi:hypothetical protein
MFCVLNQKVLYETFFFVSTCTLFLLLQASSSLVVIVFYFLQSKKLRIRFIFQLNAQKTVVLHIWCLMPLLRLVLCIVHCLILKRACSFLLCSFYTLLLIIDYTLWMCNIQKSMNARSVRKNHICWIKVMAIWCTFHKIKVEGNLVYL